MFHISCNIKHNNPCYVSIDLSPSSATVKHSNTPQLQVSTCHGVRAYLKKTGIVRHTETEENRNRDRWREKDKETQKDQRKHQERSCCMNQSITFSFLQQLFASKSGGSFFLPCEDLGRIFDHTLPTCVFFFFFLKWRLNRTH